MLINTAVILAAGNGTRLRPITDNRSKAMLPILGKPIVERLMDELLVSGIEQIILVISPKDGEIISHFQSKSTFRADIQYVHQTEPIGTADALRRAASLIQSDFILSACDNLVPTGTTQQLVAFWKSLPDPNAVLCVMRIPRERSSSTGVVFMEGTRIIHIYEKPKLSDLSEDFQISSTKVRMVTSSLPLYALSRKLLDYLPEVEQSSRGEYEVQDAIQMLIEREGNVSGFMVDKRLTLTNTEDLLTLNLHFFQEASFLPRLDFSGVGPNTQLIHPLYIESGVVLGSDCRIGPKVFIESGVRMGSRVKIRNSVILRNTIIQDDTEINERVVI